jgi:AcrR family transcriptional regulator
MISFGDCMPKLETDLALRIRDKTLALLLEKEPEEISIRNIAKACDMTSASIYYYYKDKEALFTEIKLFCMEKMHTYLVTHVEKEMAKQRSTNEKINIIKEMRLGFEAFRDWAFANKRIALLVMERFKADTTDDPEKMKKYSQSVFFAKSILDRAVEAGVIKSKNTLLDTSLCIAALWGSIESVLLQRTVPEYWSRIDGIFFTNKMIDLLLTSLMHGE